MSSNQMSRENFEALIVRLLEMFDVLGLKRRPPIGPTVTTLFHAYMWGHFGGVEAESSCSEKPDSEPALISEETLETVTLELAIMLVEAGTSGVILNEHLIGLRNMVINMIRENYICDNIEQLAASQAKFGLNAKWGELARLCRVAEDNIQRFQNLALANFPNGYPTLFGE